MNKEIMFEKELFHEKCCESFITNVKNNILYNHVQKYRNTLVFCLDSFLLGNFNILSKVWIVNQLTQRHVKKFLYPEIVQLVEWPSGSFQQPHLDISRESTLATSITYLNDNYSGGEIFFPDEDIIHKPKTGDTVIFDGQKYLHGVSEVNGGTRVTLAIWYTNNIKKSIFGNYVDLQ